MVKLLFILTLSCAFLTAAVQDIEKKIDSNKKKFEKVKKNKINLDKNMAQLAKMINAEEKAYKKEYFL